MIRTMTVSAILGALFAGVAAYTVSSSLWQTAIGLRSGGPGKLQMPNPRSKSGRLTESCKFFAVGHHDKIS